jgi:chemotaxis protein MotB
VDTFNGQGRCKAGSQISTLQGKLADEQKISSDALARIELLNQQIAALRRQIGVLNDALDAAERQDTESRAQIADLGRRLNVALAQRVQELNKFRSEFFGRLRRILADREDIRVVGDRFVFQSEVLFGKGEAALVADRPAGDRQAGGCHAGADQGNSRRSQLGAPGRWSYRQ